MCLGVERQTGSGLAVEPRGGAWCVVCRRVHRDSGSIHTAGAHGGGGCHGGNCLFHSAGALAGAADLASPACGLCVWRSSDGTGTDERNAPDAGRCACRTGVTAGVVRFSTAGIWPELFCFSQSGEKQSAARRTRFHLLRGKTSTDFFVGGQRKHAV